MADPLFSSDDYLSSLQALLPTGRVWPRDLDTIQRNSMAGMAHAFSRSDAAARQLLIEAFPATADDLLPEWEATLGLPGVFGAPASTLDGRRAQVITALTATGGQSVSYFVALAASLGFTVRIQHFSRFTVRSSVAMPLYGRAWVHAWQIQVLSGPGAALDVLLGLSDEEIAARRAPLEAVIRLYAPAHTVPIFSYEPISGLEVAIASDGVVVPIGSLAQAFGFDTSGNLTSITVTYLGNTYVQTLTYTGNALTGISAWIKQ